MMYKLFGVLCFVKLEKCPQDRLTSEYRKIPKMIYSNGFEIASFPTFNFPGLRYVLQYLI